MHQFPLSPQQRLIWSLMPTGSVQDASCLICVEGRFEPGRLRRSLANAVRHHEMLRTSFVLTDDLDEPVQVAAEQGGYALQVVDTAGHDVDVRAWYLPPQAQEPALRAVLVREKEDRHQLLLTLPALCADTRSMEILFHGIATSYADLSEDPATLPYTRFSAWQNGLLERLDGAVVRAPVRVLPFEASPAEGDGGLVRECAELPDADEASVLACWLIVLWRQAGGAEVVVGRVGDGRVYDELRPLVGPCSGIFPLTVRLAETDCFADILNRVRHFVEEAKEGQAYPGSAHDGALAWGYEWVEEPPPGEHRVGSVSFRLLEASAWSGPFRLTLRCRRHAGRVSLSLKYDTGRFDRGMVRCLLDQIVTLAEDTAGRPGIPIVSLRAVSAAETRRITVEFNRTDTVRPGEPAAHRMFEEAADKTPGRVALTFGDRSATYAELDTRANKLARHLRELGAGPEVPIGVCVKRGLDMVTALLAVHKAGAAYVPLDPDHPSDRIGAIVEGTAMPLVIADAASRAVLPEGGPRRVPSEEGAVAPLDGRRLDLPADPRWLAYVMYTSGTTGQPKGVQITHGALANFLRSMRQTPGMTAQDTLVAVTTISFDIAGLELYLPLTVGARVVVAGQEAVGDPRALWRLLARHEATFLQATPTAWRMLADSGWPGSPGMTALIGGEALRPELAARLRPLVGRLWNMYGPTETTIWSTCAELEPGRGLVSVGRPIAGTCVHVLDRQLRPVAVGMVGEVYIGGAGVARGYLGRADLTAERFVPDPFGCSTDARMYRTGDLARYDPRGQLYVLGRSDSQVKIRGFRIELGEVESVLAEHPAVSAAVATTRSEPSGGLRLDAYVLPAPGTRPLVGELRDFLGRRLPQGMLPARIGVLDAFPLTANGKVNRSALPELGGEGLAGAAEHVPARTRLEREIEEIWRSVLGVEQPSVTDNFFDLGGHSLLLVEVSGLLRERLNLDVPPLTLLEHPTIGSLARHLEGSGTDGDDARTGQEERQARAAGRERLLRRRLSVQEGHR